MDILSNLWEIFKKKSIKIPQENLILKGIWLIDLTFKPNIKERLFKYNVLLSLTKNHGCCYSFENKRLENVDRFIGKNILTLNHQKLRRDLSISILDSGYSCLENPSSTTFILDQNPDVKSKYRSKIICDEIGKKFESNKKCINIGLLGATGSIITEILKRSWKCRVTDMDPAIIGKRISGIFVENHLKNFEIIEESDAIIVTGMTISTNTIEGILNKKIKEKKIMLLYAETGSNFASEYLKLGIDIVVAEPFPFYIFNLPSKVYVYRKENETNEMR